MSSIDFGSSNSASQGTFGFVTTSTFTSIATQTFTPKLGGLVSHAFKGGYILMQGTTEIHCEIQVLRNPGAVVILSTEFRYKDFTGAAEVRVPTSVLTFNELLVPLSTTDYDFQAKVLVGSRFEITGTGPNWTSFESLPGVL